MGPFAATITAYLNALNFDGQDTRQQFWGLVLGLLVILGYIAMVGAVRPDIAAPYLAGWAEMADLARSRTLPASNADWLTPALAGLTMFGFATVLTVISATVRRLRDAGKPRKLWLLWFLPGPGTLALAWCLVRPSHDPLPKAENGKAYRTPGRPWPWKRRAKDTRGVFRNRMAFRRRQAAKERAEAAKINPFSV